MLPITVIATTLGAAWYFDFIPGMGSGATKKEKPGEVVQTLEIEKPVVKKLPSKKAAVPEPVVDQVMADEPPPKSKPKSKPKSGPKSEPEPTLVIAPEPSTVITPEPTPAISPEPTPAISPEPSPAISPEPTPVIASEPVPKPSPPEPIPELVVPVVLPPEPVHASVEDATRELQSARIDESSATLQKAHQALRASIDESLYSDLDNLSVSELKIRIIQLGTEMMERTKWEAVRLKEFLAMKEKEVAET